MLRAKIILEIFMIKTLEQLIIVCVRSRRTVSVQVGADKQSLSVSEGPAELHQHLPAPPQGEGGQDN